MFKYPSILFFILFTNFASKSQVNSKSFLANTGLPAGTTGNINAAIGDIDGDGKNDIAVINEANGKLTIYRNTGNSGSISFSLALDSIVSTNAGFVILADIDADGKKDVVVSTGTNNSVAIYRNLSSSGSILLSNKQTFAVGGSNAWGMAISDLDGDNKPDVVTSNSGGGSYSILQNTSIPGNISFAMASVITASSLITPSQVIIADLDSDSKNDLVFFNNSGNNLVIYKNISSNPGVITMSSAGQSFAAGNGPHRGDIADVDGDGKPDIVCSNYFSGSSSIFRNTSSSGTINFTSKTDFTGNSNVHSSLLRDLDDDGKPELIQSSGTGSASRISVFRNFCTPGSVSSAFFSNRIDFVADNQPRGMAIDDLDGDGKPDVITTNYSSTSVSVFKNQVIASNGLVAYYPFNGNAGDSSGFENHGTVSGATLTTDRTGNPNSAYYFNGNLNVITVPANISIRPFKTITMAAWIKTESKTTLSWDMILTYRYASSSAPFDSYKLATHPSSPYFNRWTMGIAGSTSTQSELIAKKTKQNNVWQHIAATYDGTTMIIYLDGIIDTSTNITLNSIVYSALGLYIGNANTGSHGFKGSMDEVRIYNRALSLSEIRELAGVKATYYSKSTGNLNQLSTWGENTDGSGNSPLSFDSSNVTYYVHNNNFPALGGSLKIAGMGSKLIIGNGTNTFNLAIGANDTLSCDSIYINNNITITVLGSFASNKLNSSSTGTTVQYLSSASQNMASGTYNNLIVTGSVKSLTGNTIVKSNLGMLHSINTLGFSLTLGTDVLNRGALNRTQGTIIGKFTRWFTNATNTSATGLFPVGTANRYAPFQVDYTSAPSSGGTITAEFIPSSPGNTGLPVFDISNGFIFVDKAAIDGYWKVTGTVSTGSYTATVGGSNFAGVSDYTTLRMLKRVENGSWTIPGSAVANTGNNTSFITGRSGINNPVEGEYGVGGDQSQNALPVKLIDFRGSRSGKETVLLNWKTAQETNSDKFIVQRSEGKEWINIGSVNAKGNSNVTTSYAFTDNIINTPQVINYRLIELDFNGRAYKSDVISVNIDVMKAIAHSEKLIVYPNPANNIINIENLEGEAIIYNMQGIAVKQIVQGKSDISELPRGVYFIKTSDQIIKLVKNQFE